MNTVQEPMCVEQTTEINSPNCAERIISVCAGYWMIRNMLDASVQGKVFLISESIG